MAKNDNAEKSYEVKGFTLAYPPKAIIAAEGDGHHFPGVGWDNEDALLAEYDRRGGLILKDGKKVETGAFWDFSKKRARTEPVVNFQNETAAPASKVVEETTDGEEAVSPRARGKKGK